MKYWYEVLSSLMFFGAFFMLKWNMYSECERDMSNIITIEVPWKGAFKDEYTLQEIYEMMVISAFEENDEEQSIALLIFGSRFGLSHCTFTIDDEGNTLLHKALLRGYCDVSSDVMYYCRNQLHSMNHNGETPCSLSEKICPDMQHSFCIARKVDWLIGNNIRA
jgi:hypothetical protein